ncbi:putative bifunctional diguanylate cyclase/phosphodiesterase [Pararhizobium mangrovi]|uniref:EAL domain-containing protein n=1 Tax=Pararhizobium mangrovi TaxID=2590452 RepID=A0A506U3J3_9HYPH|nr:sensor domain-containing phosphodiesterase [Pararhizobium mangrovi]TPW27575.1 EAL domain-containing protein [Pararhizobium mangrovi]
MALTTDCETIRQEVLAAYRAAGATGEDDFLQITELAARIFDMPNVCVSFVDETWHAVSRVGDFVSRNRREDVMCTVTIESDEVFVVPDAGIDPRFRNSPLVKGANGVRFYAGAPLITPEGTRVGTLCIFDSRLRTFSREQTSMLGTLAGFVVERMELRRHLHDANLDALTGLLNRQTLQRAMEHAGDEATLLLVDLDGFKEVNDTLGHAVGDRVLQAVGTRLATVAEGNGLAARLGGDEFVVFVDGSADPLAGRGLAERIIEHICEPIAIDGEELRLGSSIGMALRSEGRISPVQLLGNADLALYSAKADGRGRVHLFNQSMRSRAIDRGNVALELEDAWESNEFVMHYQPQVNLADGSLLGAEALLRWKYPYQGFIAPAAFIGVLEKSALAERMGEWILRDGCRQAKRMRTLGASDFRMAVNLFGIQFRARTLPDQVERLLGEFDLPPDALELEVTETIALDRQTHIKQQLETLKEMGVGIALDDFGTGFASLSALRTCPLTRLKVDRSFVRGIETSEADRAIIDSVIRLTKGFDLDLTVEGVETEAQAAFLRERGCREAQGFLYAKALPVADLERDWIAGGERPHELAG